MSPSRLLLIEAGTFIMGSPEDEEGRSGDEIEHEVRLTRDFYLAEMEVTQAEWVQLMRGNPSRFGDCAQCPVEQVPWYEVVDYCNARSLQEGLDLAYEVRGSRVSWDESANGYRLPTESEWEYACRAGSVTAFYNGPITDTSCDDSSLDAIGWYCGNATRTHEVGEKLPNAWGLYDMSGNVYEWCWDAYGAYPAGPITDPKGQGSGTMRVMRGGLWNSSASFCRSAYRSRASAGYGYYSIGFRVARTAE